MNITFRETILENDKDNEAIVTLLNEFMNGGNPLSEGRISPDITQKIKKLGTAKVYFCENDNDIIGIAVCFRGFSTYKQRELLNIHDFYIKKDYQGIGIGKKFLEFIENECIKNGFCRITLEVYDDNEHAKKLYERKGFIGSRNSTISRKIYWMKKDLC